MFNGAAVARLPTADKSALLTVKSRRLEDDDNGQDELEQKYIDESQAFFINLR